MIWFIIYFVFAGMFSVGYMPIYPNYSIKDRLMVDGLIFLFGWLIFPVILGGAFRIWLSRLAKKK